MRFVGFSDIPVAAVRVGPRLRKMSPAWADVIAGLIAQTGLQQPIEVARVGGQGYLLVTGAHRLEAVKRLGWEEIPARVVEFEPETLEFEVRLAEVIENLARRELSALDRAANLAELKRVYEALHPETKRGVAGGKARQGQQCQILSFADAAAEKTGFSPRHIRRAVALYEALGPKLSDALQDLPVAQNESQLRALSKLAPDLQSRVVAALRNGQARKVKAALALIHGEAVKPNPDHAAFEALLKAWNRAGAKARRRFLREFGANIDKSGT